MKRSIFISPQSPHVGGDAYGYVACYAGVPPVSARGRGRLRTQDSTPKPRRGFQVLSEGFSPQSEHL